MKAYHCFLAAMHLPPKSAFGQGHTRNFDDGDIAGWGGQAVYELSNTGSKLQIVSHKTSTCN